MNEYEVDQSHTKECIQVKIQVTSLQAAQKKSRTLFCEIITSWNCIIAYLFHMVSTCMAINQLKPSLCKRKKKTSYIFERSSN